jgi:hypothetical protein
MGELVSRVGDASLVQLPLHMVCGNARGLGAGTGAVHGLSPRQIRRAHEQEDFFCEGGPS